MSLDRAIALAQAAVAADRKGDRSAAKDCFVEAASQLLAVVKAEPDRTKAAKLAQREKARPPPSYLPPQTQNLDKLKRKAATRTALA